MKIRGVYVFMCVEEALQQVEFICSADINCLFYCDYPSHPRLRPGEKKPDPFSIYYYIKELMSSDTHSQKHLLSHLLRQQL